MNDALIFYQRMADLYAKAAQIANATEKSPEGVIQNAHLLCCLRDAAIALIRAEEARIRGQDH